MDYTTLGRTGLRVSVAGLGSGGNSRLGMTAGMSEAEAADMVRYALDLGINVLDCGNTYGTERAVGVGLKGVPRDRVVLSSKFYVRRNERFHSAAEVLAGLEESLSRLGTDYLDIFFLHGVTPVSYGHAVQEILPAIRRAQEKGKFRYLGLTEAPPRDIDHEGLHLALDGDHFDVAMLAFSPTNQNARACVFPRILAKGWGAYVMYVGRFLADSKRVRTTLAALAAAGEFPADLAARDDPLDFLVEEGGAMDLMDAAYRYARHEPGADVVLFGSGNREHIARNVQSITSPPLANPALARLETLFGGRSGVGVAAAALYSNEEQETK